MTSAPLASADRRLPRARTSQAPSASGPTAFPGAVRPSSDANRASTSSSSAAAGPSRLATVPAFHRPRHDDPVRAAQEEATRVWRADLRRLLERAEDRFADICWTTAPAATQPDHSDLDSDLRHSLDHAADAPAAWSQAAPPIPISQPSTSLGPAVRPAPTGTLIWAHKAILYARAPNTFQTRFLNLRSPAAQLQHIGSTASLVSLPLHRSTSQLSLASHMSNSTQTASTPSNPAPQASKTSTSVSRAGMPPKPRKSIRGAAPPSSFSMTKPSLRKPISRSSISRPLRRAAGDDAASIASGFATSDSEGEGALPSSLRSSRFINTRPTATPVASASLTSPSKLSQASSAAPARKSSFASVTSAADSHLTADNASVVSDASTLRAPISLGGVSHAFFDATLQYLYTGEEAMVDAFEFLFEDRLAPDSQATPEEKLDKLRSDLTYMWRSKLYSDVKIVLGDDDDARNADDASMAGDKRRRASRLADIPDANMSVLSLAQTVDTDRIDESDDDDELTLFSTHRMILASRSEYFASMLLSSYADAGSQVLRLPSPPFTPASLHFTLGFLYTGTLFFSNRTFDLATAFALWRAGAYLQIATLQALVTALIDREFCHAFACAPPCRKCLKRVPRALAFAASPDVGEPALLEPAIAAVSGPHFGMYWAKEVGNLDPLLQDRIVDAISARMADDPTLVVSVLRQLSIVGQRIDTERSSRWVESIRLMAETVENRLMPLLHTHFERIVQSCAWSDLLDGVGSLGDVLEKSLVMLVDGLSEARAAQLYQVLVGQVLLREQGFEVAHYRHVVETARESIVRYLKKRWINVRALGGFNRLDKWCLKELADELEVATTDLVLPDTPPKPMAPPSRLVARPGAARQASPAASAAVSARSPASTRSSSSTPRATAPVASSRLRTASTSSTASSASAASPTAQRRLPREDGEREAGPIHMRAAVLNRNAARTSVANGHRALSAASASPPASVTKTDAKPSSGSSPRTPGAAPSTVAVRPRTTPVRSAPQTSTPAVSANGRVRTHSSSSTVSTTSAASVRATSRTKLTPPGPSVRPASVAGVRSAATLVGDANKTPTKSVRPVRSSTSLSARPTRAGVSVDSAPTKKPSVPSLAAKSFLRATPGPGGTFSLSSTDSGRELRARTLSAASHKSTPEVQSNSNLPTAEARLERSDSSTTIVVHPTDGPSERGAETAAPGMRLEMGIACIVSLDCDGAAHKVRALVRYLGRIPDHTGVWVGVELRLPPTGCHAIRLTDGCLDGVRYLQPHRVGPTEDEARRERRRQLWHQVCPHTAFPDPDPAADTRDEQDQVLLPAQSVVWVIQ